MVRALLRRVAESDTLPVTLREVSEGGLCVVLPGTPPDNGARVTIEMALWRQMLYLPANVVWSRTQGGSATCGLKLHLEVTDSQTRRAFAGWVRNQAAPARAPVTARAPTPVPVRDPTPARGVAREPAQVKPRPKPERPYDKDMTEMDTTVPVLTPPKRAASKPKPASPSNPYELEPFELEPVVEDEKSRGEELFEWLFRRKP